MPGLLDEDAAPAPVMQAQTPDITAYSVIKQKVDLDIDFVRRTLKGSTELTIQPHAKQLRELHLHCRQCRPTSVQVGGITAKDCTYDDPYRRIKNLPVDSGVQHHTLLKSKIEGSLKHERELVIPIPPKLKIQELTLDPATALPQYRNGLVPGVQKQESDALAVTESQQTPTLTNAPSTTHGQHFAPLKLFIEFEVDSFREGLHWIGFEDGLDSRYPHCYVKASPEPGVISCIFPCVDDSTSRCAWEISIRCPRTLGDAFRRPYKNDAALNQPKDKPTSTSPRFDLAATFNGTGGLPAAPAVKPPEPSHEYYLDLTDEEAALDLAILCTGELSDDVVDSEDETRHTATFNLLSPICARHIGFAIGPFETTDLSAFREVEEEERLGQSAVKVTAYSLPGRTNEVKNTAFPITQCVDFYGVNFGSSPFQTHDVLFIDDFVHDTVPLAGFTMASSRLLFPEDVLEPLEKHARILTRAVAEQWMGVNVIPATGRDEWVAAGIAGYMADLFMKKLAGNNTYRWQHKLAAEKVYEVDVDRPSISELGAWLHLDPEIREFVNLKSALIMFILDRRLLKASGATGVTRIVNRILLQAKTGSLDNGQITTEDFQRTCEKLGHNKLDSFFKQWIFGAGCPIFYVTQRFNKKKLVVEIEIRQRQSERKTKPPFAPDNFARLVKEHMSDMWASPVQNTFTGPMTIRIHEADGTPYEHIVEITDNPMKLEIPYNTKYKRLKRSRRQKERTTVNNDSSLADHVEGNDSLLYCLGDILDSPREMSEWKLVEWAREEEDKMGQESYEWIRIDADFEWIGKIHLVMPLYMYISQLQQDRDLVAQYESMRFLLGSNPHQMSLTILVRTLMDTRYFWGIREMAADGIAILAKVFGNVDLSGVGSYQLDKAFTEMFCAEGSSMPRPNDFTDRVSFIIQCAIPRAMAKLRDPDGKVPMPIRRFFVDKLRFNDNSANEFSDAHYIATLMQCLADSLIASHREPQPTYSFNFGEEDMMDADNSDDPDKEFEREAITEIERYRRIDEWISSHQNLYTTTVLDCLQKLTNAKIVKNKITELLQYTRAGNADNVRLQAFTSLSETGSMRSMHVMKYLLHSIATDPSPFVRYRLLQCFGEALGHIALGNFESTDQGGGDTTIEAPNTDNLVLEGDINSETRHLEVTRKENVEGALPALKFMLEREAIFRESLWQASTSPMLTLNEIGAFVDIAALIYEPLLSFRVALELPQNWRCESLGKGKVLFIKKDTYRTKPVKDLVLEDWEEMQKLKLKYNGPLSSWIKRAQEQEDMRILQEQIEQVERLQAQRKTSEILPPPRIPSPPQRPPPPEHRPSIKLSFGKRKQSISEIQRDESPKMPKTSRQQTPNGLGVGAQGQSGPVPTSAKPVSKSSSSAGPRPALKRSKIVRFRCSEDTSQKIQHILSRPPKKNANKATSTANTSSPNQPTRAVSTQPHGNTSGLALASGLFSPSGSLGGASSTLNAGGFRSYGANPSGKIEAIRPVTKSVVKSASPSAERSLHQETGSLPHPSHSQAPSSSSKQSVPAPKNIIKLKLSRKPGGSGFAQ
ncbi:hypothetical protein K431DRAFT_289505 [Polychaeton citri CBS 116435]|uniref:Transcription initiation factor TFIID subunit 2 n=1 Tax=Polychaeton citri CBS 116435 TaxID=1314669 RepID=A0A9P4PYT7_9PEZI|nr:hypothetical protein K431DRAFT_289505 [Polychaeton citri CBS 116435]